MSWRLWPAPGAVRTGGLTESREAAAALWAEGTPPGRLGRTGMRTSADRLGWVDLPLAAAGSLPAWRTLRRELVEDGLDRLVVVGMGGSGRAAETLCALLPRDVDRETALEARFLNTLAPEAVRAALGAESLPRTVFLIASKSGTTVETRVLEALIVRALEVSGGTPGRQLMALSDPGSPLLAHSAAAGYRMAFAGMPSVGGRFSALGAYGLLPAVLAGCRVEAGLEAARRVRGTLDAPSLPAEDPGVLLGVFLARLEAAGRCEAHISAAAEFSAILPWLEQLFSENTGKQGRGILPVLLPPSPRPPTSGSRVFSIHLGPAEGEDRERLDRAAAAGLPVVHAALSRATVLGELFRWQVAASVAAYRMGVDPYDQPDVEGAKAAARQLMVDPGSAPAPPPVEDRRLAEFLGAAREGGLAINGFGHRSPRAEAAFQRTARLLADRLGVVPAVGFGSSLLHSLGQIEKGGPPGLGVLMLSWEPEADLLLPPAGALPPPAVGLGAGAFARLQAAADYQELQRRGRRVLWLPAPVPGEPGLSALLARLDACC